ncbi:MAG: ribonuclease H-like domain-containing protein [Pirellulales bacterium]
MKRKYVAFDIETASEWPDGADWRPYRPLGISCAATLPSDADAPTLWHGVDNHDRPAERMSRDDAARLVDYLRARVDQGYAILTWNGLAFDFAVLAEESGMAEACKRLARGHVDMMFHVFCTLGHPVGLEAAARGFGLAGKTEGMHGIMAPGMWASGKHREVLDYVAQDARTTWELAELCEREKCFRWVTRRGKTSRMDLPHGWLAVDEAMRLPEPDTSWMSRPMSRRRFTGWLRP